MSASTASSALGGMLISLVCTVGCHSTRPHVCQPGLDRHDSVFYSVSGNAWLKTELYFGLSKAGGEVSDEEWREFVANEITPRFPDGLTVVGAYGQWKNSAGTIQYEASRVMILLHSRETMVHQRIEELIAAYCRKFDQESVLRVTSNATVSFSAGTNLSKTVILPLK